MVLELLNAHREVGPAVDEDCELVAGGVHANVAQFTARPFLRQLGAGRQRDLVKANRVVQQLVGALRIGASRGTPDSFVGEDVVGDAVVAKTRSLRGSITSGKTWLARLLVPPTSVGKVDRSPELCD